jgi:triacylglycerol lipase
MRKSVDESVSVIIQEMLTCVDLAALFTDPAFYGMGVARGRGKSVVVIPGLFGSDFYLQPLRNWLCCAGYSPIRSSLNFNAGCLQRLCSQVLDQISGSSDDASDSIALIGHSRGGALAWALASQLQARVSHLVMLGSPVASLMASVETGKPVPAMVGQTGRAMMQMSSLIRHVMDPDCNYPNCGCPFVDHIMRPLSPRTAILSIYGREDLMVPKEAQITEGQTLEVGASHIGLVYNPDVYRALGRFLSRAGIGQQSPSSWRSAIAADPGL